MHQFSSSENWVVRSPGTFFSGLFFLHLLLCCFMPVCSMLFSGLCAWYVLLYPISCRLFSVASVPDTFLSHVLHAVFWSLCQTHACNFIPCFAGCFLVSVLDTSYFIPCFAGCFLVFLPDTYYFIPCFAGCFLVSVPDTSYFIPCPAGCFLVSVPDTCYDSSQSQLSYCWCSHRDLCNSAGGKWG